MFPIRRFPITCVCLRNCLIPALIGMVLASLPSMATAQAGAELDPNRVLGPTLAWFDAWRMKTGERVDFASLKSCADLPPLLRFQDGTPVKTPADWQKRKVELRQLLTRYITGSFPDAVPPLGKVAVLREVKMPHAVSRIVQLTYQTATPSAPTVSITIELLIPDGPGPFPIFMTQTNHRAVGLIGLSRGYLVCMYPGADVDDQCDKFAQAYPQADWGRIARRAWLGSRVLDYLVSLPAADKTQVAITGHSRNGKQAVIAAAFDERITAVVPSSSGSGGSGAFRFMGESAFEESVEFMSRVRVTADWYHPRIRCFVGREDRLPVDNHALVALVAPRHCLISSAYNDSEGTTFSDERTYVACQEVCRLLGKPDTLRIRWRDGGHEWNASDAQSYFDWFDHAFGRAAGHFPEEPLHEFTWSQWKARQKPPAPEPPPQGDPARVIRWSLGEEPPRGVATGGRSEAERGHEALLIRRDNGQPAGITKLSVNFGEYVHGDLYYKTGTTAPMPVVIWLHPYSYSTGYTGTPWYMVGPQIYHRLAQQGIAVFAFDQVGFGRRVLEGRDFYRRYPQWSKLGKMVEDVRAAVDFLTNAAGRQAPGKDAANLPPLDPKQIYCLGYSLGGLVGLYATALDERIAGLASFSGFTPMRTDTDDKPTGGVRRLWEWHGLQPRLGFYHGREKELPFDFEDVLGLIAPRPCLIVSPIHDRDADAADVRRCVRVARKAWEAKGAAAALNHQMPDDYNRFQSEQHVLLQKWLDSLIPKGK